MPVPYQGRGAYVGVVEETTWGTAVSPRVAWDRATSVGIKRTITKVVVDHLSGPGLGSSMQQHQVTVSDRTAGAISGRCHFNSLVLSTLLKHAMGAVATTGVSPYTHAFTPAEELPTGLTIEQGKGTGFAEVFEGCKVSKLSLSVSAIGQPLQYTADIVAETSGGVVAVGSPTLVAMPVWIQTIHTMSFTWNSVAYVVKSVEITIDNGLEERDQLGSGTTLEPVRGKLTEALVRVTIERLNNVLQSAYEAGTAADGVFSITSGAYSLTFYFYDAPMWEYSGPDAVSAVGPLEQTITFRAFTDGTDEAIEITLVNTNATAV